MELVNPGGRSASDTRARRPTGSLGQSQEEPGSSSAHGSPEMPEFRTSKSGRQPLEPRHSDPLEHAESSVLEWEGEPILNLVTAVLGCGVLGFPFCFKTCGLGLAVMLVLVTLAAAELSMRLLLMSSQLTGKRSYEELARHTYGRAGQLAVGSCIIAMNVGSVVAYLNILTDTVSTVAGTVIPPGAEPSRNMMLFVVTMAGCLPVALFVKSAQLLTAVNSVSMVFLLFFCCIIALLPFSPTPNTGPLLWWRWEGVLVSFPIVSYGFTAHQYLFQIYPASQRPSMRKMTVAVQRGMLLSAAIYVAVGACGYSAFGTRTAGDVLRNLGSTSFVGAHGVRLTAERVLKYGFGVSLLGTIPLTVVPLHTTFAPWLALCSPAVPSATKQGEMAGVGPWVAQLSKTQENMLTVGILGMSYAMAVLLPNVEFVFGLAGSTASTLMAFILPAAIFLTVTSGQRGMMGYSVDMLRSSSVWRQRRRMAGVLLMFGCMAGVLCTHALVVSIQEEHEVVQLAQELVREETKAAVAVQTEQKAKQVAEAVATVARAAQDVDAAQAEATGQAQMLARAAQALNDTGGGGKRKRQAQKAAATSELALVHGEVDRAVKKLENVTATLGATASRMRNETSKAAADGGAGAAQDQQLQLLADQRVAQDLRQGDGDSSSSGSSSSGRGSTHTGGTESSDGAESLEAQQKGGVQAADEAATAVVSLGVHQASSTAAVATKREGIRDDEVAEALEKVANTANDALTAVKQSKLKLEVASAEAATGKGSKAKAVQLGKAISDALNATAEAAAKLNATSQALKAVEQEKTSELVSMITQLAQDEEEEERQEAAKQVYEQHTLGRKEGLGFTAATAAEGALKGGVAKTGDVRGSSSDGDGSGSDEGQPGNNTAKPREQIREVLKQAAAALGNGTTVNVAQMVQAAIEAASTVVATSKASVEQTIEKKRSKVAVRAIEIAKELHSGGNGAGAAAAVTSNRTSNDGSGSGSRSGTSVIKVAEVKHDEIVRQGQQQANVTTAAAYPPPGRGDDMAAVDDMANVATQ